MSTTLTWLGHSAFRVDTPDIEGGRQAHLRRPVPQREPEVPREREGTGARRRDLHHPRAQRPRRRHARAGEEVRVPGRRAGRGPRLPRHARLWRGRRRTLSEQGRHGRPGRNQGHAGARPALVQLHDRGARRLADGVGDRLHRRAVGPAFDFGEGPKLDFAGDTNVFGDMALIARLYPGGGDPPDRRPLHDGPKGGGGRVRAARREALRAVPLGDVPDPCRHSRQLRELAPGVEVIAPEPGGRWSREVALVRRDGPARTRARARRHARPRGRARARRGRRARRLQEAHAREFRSSCGRRRRRP